MARTGRSTGCACRASTPRPASPPCWARRRTGSGGSAPSGRCPPRRGPIAATPWFSTPASRRPRAPSKSPTSCRSRGPTIRWIWCARNQELEADRLGLTIMARAGFDPRAAVTLWRDMERSGGQPPAFLSTHPDPGQRIEQLQALMPEALATYRDRPS
ncbi:MAG: M48 family metalloprotease [Alphaproteobacteria bacterium]|nr:M48 family metalloprotease [Alphaproteobacteria bacterium]